MMQQHPLEIERFGAFLRDKGVVRYLEIGSRTGETLLYLARNFFPLKGRIISVDLPSSKDRKHELMMSISLLVGEGHDAHVIFGDSTDPAIIQRAKDYGPYDCVFIDANHHLPYVKKDWSNYKDMARIVAFHDIGHPVDKEIQVKDFWDELKLSYEHKEFKYDTGHNGIGVLWR